METQTYSGAEIKTVITYVFDNPEYVKDGYVILGFEKLFNGSEGEL